MLLSCLVARLDPTKSVHFTPTFQRDRHIELERSFMFEILTPSRRSFPGFSLANKLSLFFGDLPLDGTFR